MTKTELQAALDEATQTDKKTAGAFLNALAAVVGADPLPRTELTKRLWEYIREHKLQDAQDRRRIRADDKLRAVLEGQDSVTMFELTKFVNRHLA